MPNRVKFAQRRARKEMKTVCLVTEKVDTTDPTGFPLTQWVPKATVMGKLDALTFYAGSGLIRPGGQQAGAPIQVSEMWFEFPIHPTQPAMIADVNNNPVDLKIVDHIEAGGIVYEIRGIRGPTTLEAARYVDVARLGTDQPS